MARSLKHRLVIPRYSQFLDVPLKRWQPKACGVVAVAMAVEAQTEASVSIVEMLRTGIQKGFFINHVGWTHAGLAALAAEYGAHARAYDWAKHSPVVAWKYLQQKTVKGLALASIHKDFLPGNSGHLVLITGIGKTKIYYHDPISRRRKDIARSVSIKKFLAGWKRRIILVQNPKP